MEDNMNYNELYAELVTNQAKNIMQKPIRQVNIYDGVS